MSDMTEEQEEAYHAWAYSCDGTSPREAFEAGWNAADQLVVSPPRKTEDDLCGPWRGVFGDVRKRDFLYKPAAGEGWGKSVAGHYSVIRATMEELEKTNPKAADVLAIMIWNQELVLERERLAWERVRELEFGAEQS